MSADGLSPWKTWQSAAIALAAATLLAVSSDDSLGATAWLTGNRLQKRLARPVGISWSGNRLRKALDSLSRAQQVAVLIDRRVDPGQKLELQLNELPLEATLHEIARRQELGVSLLRSVVYFGPLRASSPLRTIAAMRTEEIRRLPVGLQRRFLLPKRFGWDDFAMPRELLVELAEQSGLEIEGAHRVPHDLWAAADLPPLSLVDRLTLILVQFDLTFQLAGDAKTLSLVPLPDEVALTRGYPGGPDPKATAKKYAALVPQSRIKVVGSQVYVSGLLEAHERLSSAGRPPKQPTPGPADGSFADKRFTLRAQQQPAEALLQALAEKLSLDFRIDRRALQEAGISLETRVSLSVKDATIDELLSEVLRPTGLKFRRRGSVVEIRPE